MLTKGEYKDKFKFSTMVDSLEERIKRARYEQFLLKLASAYDGYTFDLPAFIDFIGRISRTGIMHFHERDLLRSRAGDSLAKQSFTEVEYMHEILLASTGFHHHSFQSLEEAAGI